MDGQALVTHRPTNRWTKALDQSCHNLTSDTDLTVLLWCSNLLKSNCSEGCCSTETQPLCWYQRCLAGPFLSAQAVQAAWSWAYVHGWWGLGFWTHDKRPKRDKLEDWNQEGKAEQFLHQMWSECKEERNKMFKTINKQQQCSLLICSPNGFSWNVADSIP